MASVKFDGSKLVVREGSFKVVAEGDFIRIFQRYGRHGYTQILGIDENGFSNLLKLLSVFIRGVDDITKAKNEKIN